MVVAAHISSKFRASQLFDALQCLAKEKTNIQFIIFSDQESSSAKEMLLPNMQLVVIKPIKTNLRLQYWYNYQLPSLLKKQNANLFIGEEGICSLKSKVPQYIWIANTSFLNKKSIYILKKNSYQRKNFLKLVQSSQAVLVREKYMTDQIMEQYNLARDKFYWVGEYFYTQYHPIEWEKKEALLDDVSGGIEYFYCECNSATRDNITIVLKAFSLFKKRLKSGLKLVLLLNDVLLEDCVKDFRLYKHRNDVIVKESDGNLNFYSQLIAASYAVIYLPKEITGVADIGLTAMISAVPVIANECNEHHSLYRDAALLSQLNEQSVAENMMLLYKNENLRGQYIERGQKLTSDYTLPKLAERLWETILATLPKKAQ